MVNESLQQKSKKSEVVSNYRTQRFSTNLYELKERVDTQTSIEDILGVTSIIQSAIVSNGVRPSDIRTEYDVTAEALDIKNDLLFVTPFSALGALGVKAIGFSE